MRIVSMMWSVVCAVGLVLTLWTGYLVVRGPFLGGEAAEPVTLMLLLGGFVVGIVVFALGGTKLARATAGF